AGRRRPEVPGAGLRRGPQRGREVPPEAQGVRGALQGGDRARRRPQPALLPAMQPVPCALGVRRLHAQLPAAPAARLNELGSPDSRSNGLVITRNGLNLRRIRNG
uniref:Uncharacterized protein n=1 Tax=Oryza brachyantha TaxID=4533 RepID=J3ML62_ORYBR